MNMLLRRYTAIYVPQVAVTNDSALLMKIEQSVKKTDIQREFLANNLYSGLQSYAINNDWFHLSSIVDVIPPTRSVRRPLT